MKLEPYVFLSGQAEAAIAFYQQVLGARLEMLMRFADSPDPIPPEHQFPGYEQQVMHASLMLGEDRLMLSDGCGPGVTPQGFSLSITCADLAEAQTRFIALAEGGRIDMPFGPTFWAPGFGTVTDRFGIQWMVSVPSPEHG